MPPPEQRGPVTRDGAAIRGARALIVLALLLPLVLLALASWYNRGEVVREAETRVERTLRLLQEHAVKVFETQKLILDRVNGRLRGMDWGSEEQRADLHAFLAALQADYDQIATVTITDAEGRMKASGRIYPADPEVSFADHDWFIALRQAGPTPAKPVYISRALVGQSDRTAFNFAEPVFDPDGSFQGAIALSIDRSYFEDFYREVDPDPEHSVVMVRFDGELLARHPGTAATRISVDAPLFRRIAERNGRPFMARSDVDGTTRIFAFGKVAAYPVYIGFGLSETAVSAQWWRNVLAFAPVAGLAALALLAASTFALHQTRQEQSATRRWRETAAALAAEGTERQRAEAQLRQAQKMEAVGLLTGGVAHDFNNLLTVVIGNLEMVQRRVRDADQRIVRGIERAMEGARRAATLTHRLLAFSRQSPLNPERIDVNRLVQGMSDLFRRTLGERVTLETVLAGGLWLTEADANGMESAILNLAVNARDAMPDGGRLTIETGNVYLDEAYAATREGVEAGQYVMVAVSDTGTGMAPEIQGRAFEPFFTTKPVGKGTGLGLAQVYGFMGQSGGHAAIHSEPGHGSTIKLYVPRMTPAAEARYAAAGAAMEIPTLIPGLLERAPRPDMTVLAVEDDAMVRAFSVAALEEAGYRVLQAPEGPDALALLDAHPEIDLLFTDVVLTGPQDGRQLADAARARRPGLKVLFTTGYTPNAIIHHGRLDASVDLIVKPFTAAGLGRKVRAVLTVA